MLTIILFLSFLSPVAFSSSFSCGGSGSTVTCTNEEIICANDAACYISCSDESGVNNQGGCSSSTLTCAPDQACYIDCASMFSCGNVTINGNGASLLSIEASDSALINATILCPAGGDCTVLCGWQGCKLSTFDASYSHDANFTANGNGAFTGSTIYGRQAEFVGIFASFETALYETCVYCPDESPAASSGREFSCLIQTFGNFYATEKTQIYAVGGMQNVVLWGYGFSRQDTVLYCGHTYQYSCDLVWDYVFGTLCSAWSRNGTLCVEPPSEDSFLTLDGPVQPSKGNVIGYIDVRDPLFVSFDFVINEFEATVATSASIFRVGTSVIVPGVWVALDEETSSLYLQVWLRDWDFAEKIFDIHTTLELSTLYNFKFILYETIAESYLDGVLYQSMSNISVLPHTGIPVYLGDVWSEPAYATVTNLVIQYYGYEAGTEEPSEMPTNTEPSAVPTTMPNNEENEKSNTPTHTPTDGSEPGATTIAIETVATIEITASVTDHNNVTIGSNTLGSAGPAGPAAKSSSSDSSAAESYWTAGGTVLLLIILFAPFLIVVSAKMLHNTTEYRGIDQPRYLRLLKALFDLGDFVSDIMFAVLLYLQSHYLWAYSLFFTLIPHLISTVVCFVWVKESRKTNISIIKYANRYDWFIFALSIFSGFYSAIDFASSRIMYMNIFNLQMQNVEYNKIQTWRFLNNTALKSIPIFVIQLVYVSDTSNAFANAIVVISFLYTLMSVFGHGGLCHQMTRQSKLKTSQNSIDTCRKNHYKMQISSRDLKSIHKFVNSKLRKVLAKNLAIDDYGIEVYYCYHVRHGIISFVQIVDYEQDSQEGADTVHAADDSARGGRVLSVSQVESTYSVVSGASGASGSASVGSFAQDMDKDDEKAEELAPTPTPGGEVNALNELNEGNEVLPIKELLDASGTNTLKAGEAQQGPQGSQGSQGSHGMQGSRSGECVFEKMEQIGRNGSKLNVAMKDELRQTLQLRGDREISVLLAKFDVGRNGVGAKHGSYDRCGSGNNSVQEVNVTPQIRVVNNDININNNNTNARAKMKADHEEAAQGNGMIGPNVNLNVVHGTHQVVQVNEDLQGVKTVAEGDVNETVL